MKKVAQRFGILRRTLMLAGVMLITVAAQASTFIKDIKLIGGTKTETANLKNKLTAEGWTFINYDLNKGCGSESDYVYLLYKADENNDGVNWGYITDLIIHEEKNPPSTLTLNGRLYYKAPYEGGEWFVSHYGDLNSNSSGAYIYLYYTKALFPDNRAVTSITINATSSGAVRWDGNGSVANLNKGCGSESANIYMHFSTATAMTGHQPQASLESCTAGKYQISMSGWAYDPDSPTQNIGVQVKIYQSDGTTLYLEDNLTANQANANAGVSGNHGFAATYTVIPAGTYQVELYAIDYNGDGDTQIGTTQTVTVTGTQPSGRIDACTGGEGQITVSGWAYDPDSPTQNIGVQVKIYQSDGTTLYLEDNLTADQANANSGVSGNHGFSATFTNIPIGTYKLELFAIDYNGDGNTQIGTTQTVTVPGTQPSGRIDVCTGGEAQITVSGWAYDPDATTESIGVHVKIYKQDGTTLYKEENLTADHPRNDVNNTYHITGQHGYSATIGNLLPGTYKVKVYAVDHNGDGNPQIGATQTVTVTPGPVTVTIGDGVTEFYILPFAMDWDKSLSQQIYTAEEIGMPGTINAISFQYASSWDFFMSCVQVYLKHTDKNEFDKANDRVPLSAEDKVFEGTFSATGAGWVTITLDTPFEYDGNSNLLIHCEDTEGCFGTNYRFFVHATENAMSIAFYTGEGWSDYSIRNNIRLTITPGAFLKPENLAVSSCTEQTATLTWTRQATANTVTGYAYQYKRAGDASWSAEVTTTATSITLSGLTASTNYDFRVKTLYGSDASAYATLSFATVTPLPYECGFENGMGCWDMVDVNFGGHTGIKSGVTHSGENGFMFNAFSEFEGKKPQYLISPRFAGDVPMTVLFYHTANGWNTFQVGYSTTTNDVSAFTWGEEIASATDLQWTLFENNFPIGTRFIAIKYINNNSRLYLDDFTFMANFGPKPTELTVSSLTDTQATLTWNRPQTDNTITGYAYQYKKASDASWSAEMTTTATTATISNLTADTDYDFRVRTLYGSNPSAYAMLHFTFIANFGPKPTELTVSSLTDTQATLTWNRPQTDNTITGYAYQYKKASDASWSAEMTTTATTVTISNLTADTDYDFRVRTLYGSNPSAYATLSFATVTPLPYECGFENGMGCWDMVDVYWGHTGIAARAKHDGENGFMFWGTSLHPTPQYLISPLFAGTESLVLSFYYKNYTNNCPGMKETFHVGYSTTTNDISAFTWGEEISISNEQWILYENTFPTETRFIAVKYTSANLWLYLDDFTFMANSGPKPTDLAVSSCTEQTATLTWTAPATSSTVTGYAYQYKKASDAYWSAEVTTTATTATISNLTADTDYDFRVRTLYGSNMSTYQTLHFTTATPLPHEQGFENGMGRWSMVDTHWGYTGINTNAKHDGEYGFMFTMFFSGEHGPQYMISPRFPDNDGLTVSFYHYAWITTDAKFKIGYSTTSSDPAAFTWLEEITPAYHSWNRAEYILPEGTRYVAISFDYVDNEYGHILYLDDFSIEENSTYAKPVGVAVSNLTDTEATLTWTAPDGSPTGYTYQYRRQDDASWSAETNVSGTSVTLSNLSANTSYDFRVKARYSGGKASNYVTVKFMTEAAMVSLPFTDGFENNMGGWRIVDGVYNTGISAENVRNGSNSFMFGYGITQEPQYLMSPWLDGSTPMNVSFWYKNYSEGNTSYLAGFQVGYSTTSRDTTVFIWSEPIKSTHEWQQYSASFPAGTKFVAVKWTGGYWLYLDDFSFNGLSTTLSSADDWDLLAQFVEGGWTAEGVTIKMDADFTVTKMIGTAEHPFCGTFDGQGHTLTLDISSSGRVAPFLEINGATIKNLKVTGRMIAGGVAYSGGLVGWVAGGTNLIQNCVVDALIGMSHTDGGGIVGYDNSAAITIEGCVFTGFLYSNSSSMGGAMYATGLLGGTVGNTSTVLLKNCLDASNMTGPLVRGLAVARNCYYTRYDKSSKGISGGWISPSRYAYSFATPPINIGEAGTNYGFIQAYANGLKYDGKYYMAPDDIILANASDNTTALSNKDDYFATVTLLGRILYKDGDWNTIVLPFDLELSGSPLDGDGVDVRTLDNSYFDSTNGTLTLNFTAKGTVTEIEAGKPYIIRWNKADGYDEAPDYSRDIVRPIFQGVTISTANANVETQYVDFIGTYSPFVSTTGLLLDARNPDNGACRAALRIDTPEKGGLSFIGWYTDPEFTTPVTTIPFAEDGTVTLYAKFEDNPTDVPFIPYPAKAEDKQEGSWYTIDGRLLEQAPTAPGLYMYNGETILLK